jgi:hypothetical protein
VILVDPADVADMVRLEQNLETTEGVAFGFSGPRPRTGFPRSIHLLRRR